MNRDELESGALYADNRGRTWKILDWLYHNPGEPYYQQAPDRDNATHLHAWNDQAKGKKGKFISIAAFLRSVTHRVIAHG